MRTREQLVFCDVAPRDGLQSEQPPVPSATRAELAGRLARAGVPLVEAASFVRDDVVPAMAGAEEVAGALPTDTATTFAGLVLNKHGYERLRATSLGAVRITFGTTESFQERNGGSTVDEGLARAGMVAELARADGRPVTVVLSCAFGCPYEGPVDPGVVYDLAGRASVFSDVVVLADTIGVATPSGVRSQVERVRRTLRHRVGVHLHDTRGGAGACALAAVEAGATVLDASVGGVGGCPFAPGSQGNVATEDLVWLLEREGVPTGIDLDALVETAHWLSSVLGRELPGRVHRAPRWP